MLDARCSYRAAAVVKTVVSGDEELVSLGVEDGSDSFRGLFAIGGVGGDYVKRIDCDDLCLPGLIGQVHGLCEGCCDAQACEAAGADRNINVLNLVRFSAELPEQVLNGGENLCAVSERCGKDGFGEHFFAKRYGDGACAA